MFGIDDFLYWRIQMCQQLAHEGVGYDQCQRALAVIQSRSVKILCQYFCKLAAELLLEVGTGCQNVLLVPSAALVRQCAGWKVLVHQNGRARAKSVYVKQRNADVIWLEPDAANGVKQGASVLLYPGPITDGQRIKVKIH